MGGLQAESLYQAGEPGGQTENPKTGQTRGWARPRISAALVHLSLGSERCCETEVKIELRRRGKVPSQGHAVAHITHFLAWAGRAVEGSGGQQSPGAYLPRR